MAWQLWRQDDNGHRCIVEIFETIDEAETRISELTRVLHKQTYWITDGNDLKMDKEL